MNVEQLAEELHRFYRAAFKALHKKTNVWGEEVNHFNNCPGHDHGWSHCNKKEYFRKRAQMILDYNPAA